MITKIRLFFLRRKWAELQAQILFLCRQVRVLKKQSDGLSSHIWNDLRRRLGDECLNPHRRFMLRQNALDQLLQIKDPYSARVVALEEDIVLFEDAKREVRLKIIRLKARNDTKLLQCCEV